MGRWGTLWQRVRVGTGDIDNEVMSPVKGKTAHFPVLLGARGGVAKTSELAVQTPLLEGPAEALDDIVTGHLGPPHPTQ